MMGSSIMKIINCEFKALDKPVIDRIKIAIDSSQQLSRKTVQQVKRIRAKALACCLAKREKALAEIKVLEQERLNEWQLKIALERQHMQTALVEHIKNKCEEIILDVLTELVGEVPELALDWAHKKLGLLLQQIGQTDRVTVISSQETINYPAFKQICSKDRLTCDSNQNVKSGSLTISLANGNIISSFESDMRQLLEHWNNGLELVKELNSFIAKDHE
jgi:hypothetical protein